MSVHMLLAILALTFLHVTPGYTLLRGLGFDRAWSLCLSPLPSVGMLCIMGQIYATLGVSANPLMMLVPPFVLALAAYKLVGEKASTPALPHIDMRILGLYLGLGIALAYGLYLGRLVYAEQVMQAYDVTQHIGLVRSFANAGRYSSLNVGFYLEDPAIDPFPGSMFYPASWHMMCALAMNLTGEGAPIAINASQYVLVAIVYPISVAGLIAILFEGDRRTMIAGALACHAFVYFPWTFLIFGPIYPNMAAFSTLPAIIATFICMGSDDLQKRYRIILLAIFVLSGIGLATLHPNAIFSAAVYLGPYCAWRIWQIVRSKKDGLVAPICAEVVFFAVFFGVWYACFKAPMFKAIVWESWWYFTNEWQELVNILTLSYTFGHWYEFAAQIPLACTLIIGVVCALHRPKHRWIIVPYAFACLIAMVCATREGEFKHFLSGFWYCDHIRIAGMCCICGVPLAAWGLEWLYEQMLRVVRRYNGRGKQTNIIKVAVICSALFVCLNYLPEFNLPGAYFDAVLNEGLNDDPPAEEFEQWTEARRRIAGRKFHSVHTTFGDYRTAFVLKTISENPVTEEERQFLLKVIDLTGSKDLVINNPMDGSFLAYGFDNIRAYYRSFAHNGWDESPESTLIRTNLVNMASDPDVRAAVNKIDAKYVLIISESWADDSYINLRGGFNPSLYQGITSITPETPGFELILNEEAPFQNFYLYRILPE